MQQVIKECRDLFKKHSITYYYSSLLFPRHIRHNVFILYAFVRLADEFVDNPEEGSNPEVALSTFEQLFYREWEEENTSNSVVSAFVRLAKSHSFQKEWVEAFFASMKMDLYKTRYATYAELAEYIYGSAEVIGLMMSRIMHIDESQDAEARALGASMQLINFLRDIKEDYERGRIYFPIDELTSFGLNEDNWLMHTEKSSHKAFMDFQIARILAFQKEASLGIAKMPLGVKKAVTLASEGYLYTLRRIQEAPLGPFTYKVSNRKRDIVHIFIRTLLQF